MESTIITMPRLATLRNNHESEHQLRASQVHNRINIPIILTWMRIAIIPALMACYYLPITKAHLLGSLLFTLGALTDWLDGYLARRFDQVSAFGAFLDPVADKLMVAVALVLILQYHPDSFVAVPVAVIIGREITISALREWMAKIGEQTRVKVSNVGKFKTVLQMISIILLLYHEPIFGIPIWNLGLVLLYAAVVLTLWSMIVYLRAAWPSLRIN